jgi:hypothetical protein
VQIAEWIVETVALYAAIGIVFAMAFVAAGAGALDPAAKNSSWGFRLMIFPGAVALWPLLAQRWLL